MKRQKGAILVEAALVLPVFIYLILGGLDLIRLVNAKADLDSITISTANCYVSNACGDPQMFAGSLARGFLMAPAAVTVSCSGQKCSAQYAWIPLSPFVSKLTLKSESTAVR